MKANYYTIEVQRSGSPDFSDAKTMFQGSDVLKAVDALQNVQLGNRRLIAWADAGGITSPIELIRL